MKDFYDVWLLAKMFDFEGSELAQAVTKTFANRRLDVDPNPVALTRTFMARAETQLQWSAFVKRSKLEHAPATLEELRDPLREFLIPVATAVAHGGSFSGRWPPGGPWAA